MGGPFRVCHVITTTSAGGAEAQLCALLEHSPPWLEHVVVGLQPAGELAPAMEAAGAEVISLGLSPGPRALLRGPGLVRRVLARVRPRLVQTWLYHADLLGTLAAARAGVGPLVWTLRNADLKLSRSTRLVVKACLALSGRPAAIVANSRTGAAWHQGLGYPARKLRVIPNGFDTDRFRPDPAARAAVRAELGIPEDALVVGRVARLDPAKDYPGLADAARLALKQRPRLFFLLVGQGVEPAAPGLEAWQEPPLAGRSLLLGYRSDVPRLMAAMDLHLSNSLSEGLPNAVGEAMAAGLPNLVTDAGDSRELVGDTGLVVEPGQPYALGAALAELAGRDQEELARRGEAARRRIQEHYSLQAMVRAYAELYLELCGEAPAGEEDDEGDGGGGASSSRSSTREQSGSGQEDQATDRR